MLQTELNSTSSLVPRQRRHKYFACSPLQLVFMHLCLEEISIGVYRKAHRVVKYLKFKRMNPSIEHRELMLAWIKFRIEALLREHVQMIISNII